MMMAMPITSRLTLACSATRLVRPNDGARNRTTNTAAMTRPSLSSGRIAERRGRASRVRLTLKASSTQSGRVRASRISPAMRNSVDRPGARMSAYTPSRSACRAMKPMAVVRRRVITTKQPQGHHPPTERRGHSRPPISQVTKPRKQRPVATASSLGTRSRRILASQVSTTASITHSTGSPTASTTSRAHEPDRTWRQQFDGQHQHDPVPGGRRPLQIGQIPSGVLEQRTFVDHGELEMGVGIVDGLASDLDEHHQSESHHRDPVSGQAPDGRSGPGIAQNEQIGAPGGQGHQDHAPASSRPSAATLSMRSRLALMREKPLPVSQEAAARANRDKGQQADEQQRVVPGRPRGRAPADGHEQQRDRQTGDHHQRRHPVQDRGALRDPPCCATRGGEVPDRAAEATCPGGPAASP